MPTVTVRGALGEKITLSYDNASNATLAQQIANAITAGIQNHTIFAYDDAEGIPPPTLPPASEPTATKGEYVATVGGATSIPAGYDYVVDGAKSASITGNGDANEQVLVGKGDLTFNTSTQTGGSGTIVGGRGDNQIIIPASDAGNWDIVLGNGDNTITALGGGNDTISLGTGRNVITLGTGNTLVTDSGKDTIYAGSGNETIASSGSATDQIHPGSGNLTFLAAGSATVFSGPGSVTIQGGSGTDSFHGGAAGNNSIVAGTGKATLFGGGDGDQLFANGSKAQALYAGPGNETLSGTSATGSDTFVGGSGNDSILGNAVHNTFVAGDGNATIQAVQGAKNVFELFKGVIGQETVMGLDSTTGVSLVLNNYTHKDLTQSFQGNNLVVQLSDGSTITFENVHSPITKVSFPHS